MTQEIGLSVEERLNGLGQGDEMLQRGNFLFIEGLLSSIYINIKLVSSFFVFVFVKSVYKVVPVLKSITKKMSTECLIYGCFLNSSLKQNPREILLGYMNQSDDDEICVPSISCRSVRCMGHEFLDGFDSEFVF